jgi:hypothetical protein
MKQPAMAYRQAEYEFDLGFVRRDVWYEQAQPLDSQALSVSPSVNSYQAKHFAGQSHNHFVALAHPDSVSPVTRPIPSEEVCLNNLARYNMGSPRSNGVSPQAPGRGSHLSGHSVKLGSNIEIPGLLNLENKGLTFFPLTRIPATGVKVRNHKKGINFGEKLDYIYTTSL